MSDIRVFRAHRLGREGARRAAERVVHELRHRHRIALETHWEGDTLYARGRGFDAVLETTESDVYVSARLGLPLRLLRGRIEEEVERYLDRYLDGSPAPDGTA